MTFNSGANAYAITASATITFTISGTGITNNSGATQKFVADADIGGNSGTIFFSNAATAGNKTVFTANGGVVSGGFGGTTAFFDSSTASKSTFIANGTAVEGAYGGETAFVANSNSGHSSFTANGGAASGPSGGVTFFNNSASAGNSVFVANGGTASGASGGLTEFAANAMAASGTFTTNAGTVSGAGGGFTEFLDNSTAGNGVFVTNGATVSRALGGNMVFLDGSTAANATLIVNGGSNGGEGGTISFVFYSDGGLARTEVFGNGRLDFSEYEGPNVSLGSFEGDGNIFLGAVNLTIGGNNRNTIFSGVIQDGGQVANSPGSLTKSGNGILTLSGANTYTGTTTVNAGALAMNGSGASSAISVTGGMFVVNGSMPNVSTAAVSGGSLIVNGSISGGVTANGGTLGGSGQIGAASLNKRSTLSPGNGSTGRFRVAEDLKFVAGATYSVELNGAGAGTQYDQTVVGRNVNLGNATLLLKLGFDPAKGTTFTIIDHAGAAHVTGTFKGLKEKANMAVGNHAFQISYIGGSGNDVVLTTIH